MRRIVCFCAGAAVGICGTWWLLFGGPGMPPETPESELYSALATDVTPQVTAQVRRLNAQLDRLIDDIRARRAADVREQEQTFQLAESAQ